MAMASGRARGARFLLIPALLIGAMAMSAGGALAAPPASFDVSPASLAFGSVAVNEQSTQAFTVTTAKNKPAVLWLEFSNGPYLVTGGDCLTTWDMQVPAGTTCEVQITFTPLTAGDWSGSVTVWNCVTWFDFGGTPKCDRTHGSVTIPYSGAGA